MTVSKRNKERRDAHCDRMDRTCAIKAATF